MIYMNTDTNPARTVRPDAVIVSCSDRTVADRRAIATPQEIICEAGEFVISTYNGDRSIGVLTGRTTSRYGLACPTIVRYAIDTVVIDGAIWGVRGDRIAQTYFTRPENVIG